MRKYNRAKSKMGKKINAFMHIFKTISPLSYITELDQIDIDT